MNDTGTGPGSHLHRVEDRNIDLIRSRWQDALQGHVTRTVHLPCTWMLLLLSKL